MELRLAIFQQREGEKMIDLNKYQNEINRICQNNHVKRLTAFGSVLSEQFAESSDIDFPLELETTKGGIIRFLRAHQNKSHFS